MQRDPDLTRAEIAQRLHMQQADFDRQFGYATRKAGTAQRRVGISAAGRLAFALGRAPHELDGCESESCFSSASSCSAAGAPAFSSTSSTSDCARSHSA